jgi:hypothetical protein
MVKLSSEQVIAIGIIQSAPELLRNAFECWHTSGRHACFLLAHQEHVARQLASRHSFYPVSLREADLYLSFGTAKEYSHGMESGVGIL